MIENKYNSEFTKGSG